MSAVASAVLAKAAEEEALLGSTVVSKPIQPELDLGHMLAIDPNQTEFSEEKMPSEEDLMELGRDCAQLLINSLWQMGAKQRGREGEPKAWRVTRPKLNQPNQVPI